MGEGSGAPTSPPIRLWRPGHARDASALDHRHVVTTLVVAKPLQRLKSLLQLCQRGGVLALLLALASLASPSPFATPAAAQAKDTARPPIIMLPGIMGSRLTNSPSASGRCSSRPGGEVWTNIVGLLTFRYNQYLGTLTLSEDGLRPADPCDDIQPSGVLASIGVFGIPVVHIYDRFIDQMRGDGYQVYAFDYDWRLDVETSAQRLDAYIQRLGVPRVILVGHSMGGLVSRQYVSRPERLARVERVITVGTPYWGAPGMAQQMRSGQSSLFFDALLDDLNLWTIIRNAPGPMQLLPSEAFFQSGLPAYYFIDTDRPLATYTDTLRYFSARGQNEVVLEMARRRHAVIDRFDHALDWPDGFYHVLAGRHLPTARMVREYPCATGSLAQPPGTGPNRCVEELGYEAGDGTVPWTSAGVLAQTDRVSLCIYEPSTLATPHGGMMSDEAVIYDIRQIIENKATHTCRPRYTAKTETLPDFVEVMVGGAARVSVTDSVGRMADVVEPGYVVNDIPGALYRVAGESVFIVLPAASAFQVRLTPFGKDPLQVRVTRFGPTAGDRPARITDRAVFVDVPTGQGKITTLNLDPIEPLDELRLAVDVDTQGAAKLRLPPTTLLDATTSEDITLPQTSITTHRAASGVTSVTLTARDAGAGILKSEVSLDGGATWAVYDQPLALDPAKTPALLARSIDRAGNREYPWPSVRLTP